MIVVISPCVTGATYSAGALIAYTEINGVETAVIALGRDKGITAAIQDGEFVSVAIDGVSFDLKNQVVAGMLGAQGGKS